MFFVVRVSRSASPRSRRRVSSTSSSTFCACAGRPCEHSVRARLLIAHKLAAFSSPSRRRRVSSCYRYPDRLADAARRCLNVVPSVVASQIETHGTCDFPAKAHKHFRFHCDRVAAKIPRKSRNARKRPFWSVNWLSGSYAGGGESIPRKSPESRDASIRLAASP